MQRITLYMTMVLGSILISYSQFHIELGLSRNSPQGDHWRGRDGGGGGCSIEPKYALSEKLDLGLHLGLDLLGGGSLNSFISILPTGTYRFSGKKVTPYVGLGLGLYSISVRRDGDVAGVIDGRDGETGFGFVPRVGVYLGRINLGATYNVIEDTSYLQIKIGVRILSRDLKEE